MCEQRGPGPGCDDDDRPARAKAWASPTPRLAPALDQRVDPEAEADPGHGCPPISSLDETLKLTWSFLERAQQRVPRDLAPVLASTLTEWLPHITGGRYITAAVDPRTLAIQVCGPSHNWRQADRLSHGTAEQVYLLLRVALAHHLVADGTTSPLLLDDVTVQADSKRTLQILDLLHLLSQRQQVILFARRR